MYLDNDKERYLDPELFDLLQVPQNASLLLPKISFIGRFMVRPLQELSIITQTQRLVSIYLDIAEDMAIRHIPKAYRMPLSLGEAENLKNKGFRHILIMLTPKGDEEK